MLEGLFSAAAGMEAQQTRLEAVTNDLSNLSTTGYQATRVGFNDLLYSSGGASSGTTFATGAGAAAEMVGRSRLQGAIQNTGNPLDVAIVGDGYLQVRRANGTIALTRDGSLETDARGQITTKDGLLLDPPITIPAGVAASSLTIDADGTVHGGGRKLGKIAIVTVPAPDRLEPDGDSLFSVTTASGATRPATGSILRQGALESSNVDVADALVDMMDAQRSYSLASRAIQMQDQMLQIANQIKH